MKKGFTLIELLIVIAIIGILAVAFLPSLLGAPAKARDTQRVAAVSKIQAFLVNKSLSGDKKFTDIANGASCITGKVGAVAATAVGAMIEENIADFGGVFPTDPQSLTVNGCGTAGSYSFVKFDKTKVKNYTGAVVATVEETNNANYDCTTTIGADLAPTLVAKGSLASTVKLCYVSLFQ